MKYCSRCTPPTCLLYFYKNLGWTERLYNIVNYIENERELDKCCKKSPAFEKNLLATSTSELSNKCSTINI